MGKKEETLPTYMVMLAWFNKAKCCKIFKMWHLLRGITLWNIWIERNDKVFNHEQWHESKVKQQIWDELITYAKAAWKRVVEQIKINKLSTAPILKGFDKTWSTRNILYKRHNLCVE